MMTSNAKQVAAADMARAVGIDPKAFRHALRKAAFSWHRENDAWTVDRESEKHRQMQSVLEGLQGK